MPRIAFACSAAVLLFAVAACDGHKSDTASDSAVSVETRSEVGVAGAAPASRSTSASVDAGPLSCADEIGQTAADTRAKVCLSVSPATHPPCNAANSCAMIEDEIARSCALFDGKGALMAGCSPAPQSSEAAAAVVTRYYSALNARDYSTAWQQWGDNGPPNQTLAKFTAGFAHTRATHVTIGKLEPAEGGAGSIYQSVPVIVDATLDSGAHQRFTGEYVVRRVNGVDGATPGQLRWHINSAKLATVK